MTTKSSDGSIQQWQDGRKVIDLKATSQQGDARHRGRSSGAEPPPRRGRSMDAGSHRGRSRSYSRVDEYSHLGSYGIVVLKLSKKPDGSRDKFENHFVLMARKKGRDGFRKKRKQAEGMKGHRRPDCKYRDTPTKTAIYHGVLF